MVHVHTLLFFIFWRMKHITYISDLIFKEPRGESSFVNGWITSSFVWFIYFRFLNSRVFCFVLFFLNGTQPVDLKPSSLALVWKMPQFYYQVGKRRCGQQTPPPSGDQTVCDSLGSLGQRRYCAWGKKADFTNLALHWAFKGNVTKTFRLKWKQKGSDDNKDLSDDPGRADGTGFDRGTVQHICLWQLLMQSMQPLKN